MEEEHWSKMLIVTALPPYFHLVLTSSDWQGPPVKRVGGKAGEEP